MKNIRSSIFETNSSSTHSVVIDSTTEILGTIFPNDNGEIVLNGGEFGWDWVKLRTPLEKANYCAVSGNDINMLEEVIMEQTGATNIVFNFGDSYIDHNSSGIINKYFESKETLRDFIFNNKYVICLGNDNETYPPNYYNLDFPSQDYKWYIFIPEIDQKYYFKNKPNLGEMSKNELFNIFLSMICEWQRLNHNSYDDRLDIYTKFSLNDDTIVSSFDKLNENKCLLYRVNTEYKNNKFVYTILEVKELTFEICNS